MNIDHNPFTLFCSESFYFPDVSEADDDGLLAIGGDLQPQRLISAYSRGIFPWFIEEGHVFWYSPDPRAVLYPTDFKTTKSLSKSIKKQGFSFEISKNFAAVITECANSKNRKHESGTWISDEFIDGYTKLHSMGFAESFECYREGKLVGGFYGVRLGHVFFGESMFYHAPDASKATLWFLCANAEKLGIEIIDCQQATRHILSLGAKEIKRSEFVGILKEKIPL